MQGLYAAGCYSCAATPVTTTTTTTTAAAAAATTTTTTTTTTVAFSAFLRFGTRFLALAFR